MDEKTARKPGETVSKGVAKGQCSCTSDPYASLPSELRPHPQKKGGLRQVCCPKCGQEFWTNRATDVCIPCGKTGGRR